MNAKTFLAERGISDIPISAETDDGCKYYSLEVLLNEYLEYRGTHGSRATYKNQYGYKGVMKNSSSGKFHAVTNVSGKTWYSKGVATVREAAIAYDKKMIEIGDIPVNILKRKT